ncbi:MAG: phosphoribosylamine--glycine ligase [Gammaproteobacteria bacterium]|nr:phosphoribosylamine--glycine ligase [Gammaproteobacteria bacterium]
MTKTVLVVGGGGREHALAWKAAQDTDVERVFVAPGNAGTLREPKLVNAPIRTDDFDGLADFAVREAVTVTIIGPEAPLVSGIVDHFQSRGLKCFGPTAAAAELEGSKTYSKDFLARHGIPTAPYRSFTELDACLDYLRTRPGRVVVKADGLAAGKGVVVAADQGEAGVAARDMLAGNRFGAAGRRVVVEDFLPGEEASFIVVSDGARVVPLASSQDHKTRDEGDRGPNTGGMGAYSPAAVVTPEVHQRALSEIILPTIAGMAAEGRPYVGFLYAGLMIGPDGAPRVLEFNCRMGDPETQPVMLRLRSSLVELCLAAVDGRLGEYRAQWDDRIALGVVLAAAGYPDEPRKGDVIQGLEDNFDPDVKIFHAGTAARDGETVTSGGRVLCVGALGRDVADARQRAYAAVGRIRWPGMFCRRDIGHRALSGS